MENSRLFQRAIFAGLGFLGIAGIASPALADPIFASLGPLSGPGAVDGQTAVIGASFTQVPTNTGGVFGSALQSIVVSATATETLDGNPVTFPGFGGGFNPYDGPIGDTYSYQAGYEFTLGVPSSVVFAPAATGLNFSMYRGDPFPLSNGIWAFTGNGVPNQPTLVASPGTRYFANLPEGTYTLDFTGTVNLELGQTSSLSFGTVSAVPLPGALTMFGTALIGLLGLGTQKQRGS